MNMLDSRDYTSNLLSWTGLRLVTKAQTMPDIELMEKAELSEVMKS